MHDQVTKSGLACVASWGAAELTPLLNTMLHWHIPPIIMEFTQLFCWWFGSLAAIVTVITYLEKKYKHFKDKKNKKG